jgi:hypothetical protein
MTARASFVRIAHTVFALIALMAFAGMMWLGSVSKAVGYFSELPSLDVLIWQCIGVFFVTAFGALVMGWTWTNEGAYFPERVK